MDKRLLIFFGKTGAGKDFVARLFEKEFGYYRYDADRDLTPEIIYAIQNRLEFTVEMRARYFEIVTMRIIELFHIEEKIAITQGLFKNNNRRDLMKIFPIAKWIWVDAEQSIIEERVTQRNSMVTAEYARKINRYFEEPDFACYKILNNRGQAELLNQLLLIKRDIDNPWKEFNGYRGNQIELKKQRL